MTLSKAIEISNQAVSLLACGQVYEALQLSSHAMDLFQQLGIADQGAEPARDSETGPIDQCMLLQGNPFLDDAQDVFVYRRGVWLPSMVENPSFVVTPVLIFNSALAHLALAIAIDEPALRLRLLDKALRLYRLAYNGEGKGNNTSFRFAILNNMGVIYRMLGEEAQAKECFDCLVSTMMVLTQLGASEHLGHLHNFWANVKARSIAEAA